MPDPQVELLLLFRDLLRVLDDGPRHKTPGSSDQCGLCWFINRNHHDGCIMIRLTPELRDHLELMVCEVSSDPTDMQPPRGT